MEWIFNNRGYEGFYYRVNDRVEAAVCVANPEDEDDNPVRRGTTYFPAQGASDVPCEKWKPAENEDSHDYS